MATKGKHKNKIAETFTAPKKELRERVVEAIELYEKYMLELDKVNKYEKTKDPEKYSRAVDVPHPGGKEKKISGKHSGAGKRVYGVRGRVCKPEDAERVSEESEEYHSTKRHTRFIESSLGIKSYSELAPYLAKGVERVMASLLIDILIWVDKELRYGRNDTVHDFLAYLAEQMIELNKAKNEEIKGFLKWLDREIGIGIDALTNKTAICSMSLKRIKTKYLLILQIGKFRSHWKRISMRAYLYYSL